MQDVPNATASTLTDRECLKAWKRARDVESLRPVLARYQPLVYSAALRRTGDPAKAEEVTGTVFLVLARRGQKLPRKTVLPIWLFHVTRIACRKLLGWRWWFWRRSPSSTSSDAPLWIKVAPDIDRELDRLGNKQRSAALLRGFLQLDATAASNVLRTKEHRSEKRFQNAFRRLAKRLRKRSGNATPDELIAACGVEGCAQSGLPGLSDKLLESIGRLKGKRPKIKLTRRVLRNLFWARWRRRFYIWAPVCAVFLAIVGMVVWRVESRTGYSRLISTFLVWNIRYQSMRVAEPARRWPVSGHDMAPLSSASIRKAEELYRTTNIWQAHLHFKPDQWKAIRPKYIGAMPNFLRSDGLIHLRNPAAQRSGLAGVFGYDFDWGQGNFEFGGVVFSNVAVRVKGNGSWLGASWGPKYGFKVDLNRFQDGQKICGLDDLTFNNLIWDYSYLSDALAYEFFRDCGVPAPGTAFAWFSATVDGKWDRKPLGLYLMLETVDAAFGARRLGSKRATIFKPVTYDLFDYLGEDWASYAAIYDVKTKADAEQERRVIEFSRLLTLASDEAFAARVGDFLDLDEFARFLAGQVLLSNYDSILTDGQNYYMYLDPDSDKFGFIPWDLDSSWGFFWIGSKRELERASIWHPWVGENRFIERVMKVEEFKRIYRAHLEDFLERLFVPERLYRRIDELAQLVREPIARESSFRYNKFEQAVGWKPIKPAPGESENGVNHPVHPIKKFIDARNKSVRSQLDGKSKGMILKTPAERGD